MPFHIRLGSIKKLTLEKREFFYRVPEIGIRNQTTELRREGVRKQAKMGAKGIDETISRNYSVLPTNRSTRSRIICGSMLQIQR